jgi:ribosomal protein S18 acetylase RimI-like enzyme
VSEQNIRIARKEEREKIMQTLKLAFAADPMIRWVAPSAKVYLEGLPTFFSAYGDKAYDEGTAYVANDGAAAALWLPPGVDPDGEGMVQAVQAMADPEIFQEGIPVLEQMAQFHPDEPVWYLTIIGADPAHMGKGLGGGLMRAALERIDAEGGTAYLESSNPLNISLYLRHGFQIMGHIQNGSSPAMTPMIRTPR